MFVCFSCKRKKSNGGFEWDLFLGFSLSWVFDLSNLIEAFGKYCCYAQNSSRDVFLGKLKSCRHCSEPRINFFWPDICFRRISQIKIIQSPDFVMWFLTTNTAPKLLCLWLYPRIPTKFKHSLTARISLRNNTWRHKHWLGVGGDMRRHILLEEFFSLTLRVVEKNSETKTFISEKKGKTTSKFCVSHVEI